MVLFLTELVDQDSGELGLDAIAAGDACVGFAGIQGLFVFGRVVDWNWNFIQ